MIAYKEPTKRFNIDKLQFSDYGSALTKLLFDRLPSAMKIELSTSDVFHRPSEEPIKLVQYTFDAELDKQDIRELGFIAQGLTPDHGTFFEKILTVIYNQIHAEVKHLFEHGVPKDFQTLVFQANPAGYAITGYVRDNTISITTVFKVVSNVTN